MFYGSIVALVTPFNDGGIDWHALEKLLLWHLENGTHAVVPCGTTGESPTLTTQEHNDVIAFCVKQLNGRIPLIAGTGSNSTAEAIELTRAAEAVGADAALLITPYYNKPTQDGLFAHYQAVHDATSLPIIAYDVPGRTAVKLHDTTVQRLATLPRLIGLKDATGDLARTLDFADTLPDHFLQLCGEDALTLAYYIHGGHGCISVTANIAPLLCSQLYHAWMARDIDEAQRLAKRLLPLHKAMFCETSPAPAKYALSLLGLCQPELRLPLVPLSQQAKHQVKQAMLDAGILN